MKTLYFDCSMGAAGDMLTAALLELFPHPEEILQELNTKNIPHVEYCMEKTSKCGICGTHIQVKIHGTKEDELHTGHEHEKGHSHRSLHQIEHLVAQIHIPKHLKKEILEVYHLIADAESQVHQMPVNEIHFHEVGNLDALADITAVCYLLDKLSPDQIIVSPIHVGSGQVRCAHGLLPVPAPATAQLLKGCPIYGGQIFGELCTPTGAALLKYFADDFGSMPLMNLLSTGYGMGKKDFEVANCLRAMIGETKDPEEEMYELNCNVDDMTGEQIGFALERFFAAGAVDAFTLPVQMKKNRPGTLICIICSQKTKTALIHAILQHTSTAGIRETKIHRSVLNRQIHSMETPYGTIRRKDYSGYGIRRSKYEYEDLARIAREENLSIFQVLKNIES